MKGQTISRKGAKAQRLASNNVWVNPLPVLGLVIERESRNERLRRPIGLQRCHQRGKHCQHTLRGVLPLKNGILSRRQSHGSAEAGDGCKPVFGLDPAEVLDDPVDGRAEGSKFNNPRISGHHRWVEAGEKRQGGSDRRDSRHSSLFCGDLRGEGDGVRHDELVSRTASITSAQAAGTDGYRRWRSKSRSRLFHLGAIETARRQSDDMTSRAELQPGGDKRV